MSRLIIYFIASPEQIGTNACEFQARFFNRTAVVVDFYINQSTKNSLIFTQFKTSITPDKGLEYFLIMPRHSRIGTFVTLANSPRLAGEVLEFIHGYLHRLF